MIKPWIFLFLSSALLSLSLFANEENGENVTFDEEALYHRLDKPEREYYRGLRYLLNDFQKRQYLTLDTRKKRGQWIDKFWRMNDPIPATKRNERRIEHEERAKIAIKRYSKDAFPGLDHRGETLIRFGEPDLIKEVAADLVSSEMSLDYFRFKMPGEIWFYNRLGIIAPFEEIKLDGECTYYLEIATINRDMRDWLNKFNRGENYLLNDMWVDYIEYLAYSHENLERLEYAATDELNRFYSYIENDRFFHTHDLQPNPVDFYYDVVCFKGGAGKLRAEVNLEIPTTELSYTEENWEHHSRVELFVGFLDMEMNEVVSARKKSNLSFRDLDTEHTSLIPAQFTFTVEPGYYRICLEAKDLNSNRHGCYRTNYYLQPLGGSLGISDLLFASSIGSAEGNDTFVKGTLRVIPHPMHAYRKENTIKVYYEIYGLDTDDQDYAFYSVEYSIKAMKKKRSGLVLKDVGTVISSEHKTSAYGATQFERIEIDTKELWEGIFQLAVTVTDRRIGQSATRQAKFRVID